MSPLPIHHHRWAPPRTYAGGPTCQRGTHLTVLLVHCCHGSRGACKLSVGRQAMECFQLAGHAAVYRSSRFVGVIVMYLAEARMPLVLLPLAPHCSSARLESLARNGKVWNVMVASTGNPCGSSSHLQPTRPQRPLISFDVLVVWSNAAS